MASREYDAYVGYSGGTYCKVCGGAVSVRPFLRLNGSKDKIIDEHAIPGTTEECVMSWVMVSP